MPFVIYRLVDLGWSGVDLFFVLSGFLITGILLDTRDSPSYFRTFYTRRALRIFPLYFGYLFLVLFCLRLFWFWHRGQDLWMQTNPWWYFTYLVNWKPDHGYNDLFLGHFWSLAVEEQFYFCWPLVVWLVPRRILPLVCLTIAAGSYATRYWLGGHGFDSESIYRMTPSRAESLAWGALAALALRDFPSRLQRLRPPIFAAVFMFFFYIFLGAEQGFWNDPRMRTLGVTCINLLYACGISSVASNRRAQPLLTNALLRSMGRYSYGVYVLQSIPYNLSVQWVRSLTESRIPRPEILFLKYTYYPVLVAVAYILARVSWRILEEPFLRLKTRYPYAKPWNVTPLAKPGVW